MVSLDPLLLGYVILFGAAAVACWVGVLRARAIDDAETRRGLVWLLLLSGGWAAAHVGYLLVPTATLKVSFYQLGIVVGIAAVGPWLYFCSAFTGRSLHRAPAVRRLAIAVFAVIVLFKLTNPIHGLYYQSAVVATPFPHVAVSQGLFHWVAMGLAYALAAVGYFMLLERFWQVGKSAATMAVLVGVTGLPIVLDIVALSSPVLLELTYEPLGVAVFAVGVLFVYFEEFETLRLTGDREEPVVVLDAEDRVREFNRAAKSLLPAIDSGVPIRDLWPEAESVQIGDDEIIERESSSGTRYYQLTSHPFSTSGTRLGRVLSLHDVTERERYRTQLEHQNERLERFASVLSHDLRNPLNVAMGRVELAQEAGEEVEDLDRASTALERMETLIEDLLELAREGQPIDETEPVSLADVSQSCWTVVAAETATLEVDGDFRFDADPDRLQQLLENLFRNAVDHGGTDVTITVGALEDEAGFYVEDDGPGVPAEVRDEVFAFGYSTDEDGTGFGLSIVEEIAKAHGWRIELAETASGGARFEVTGVEPVD